MLHLTSFVTMHIFTRRVFFVFASIAISSSLLPTIEAEAAPRLAKVTPTPTSAKTAPPFLDGFSRKVDDVFNKALNALVEGRGDDFHALLSSSTIERETRGSGAINKIIRERFIPYFSDFSRLTANAASMPTEDPEGHKGLALCRSFETKDHAEKPFVMYIVEEEGEPVVSNLLLNKRLVDVAP